MYQGVHVFVAGRFVLLRENQRQMFPQSQKKQKQLFQHQEQIFSIVVEIDTRKISRMSNAGLLAWRRQKIVGYGSFKYIFHYVKFVDNQ